MLLVSLGEGQIAVREIERTEVLGRLMIGGPFVVRCGLPRFIRSNRDPEYALVEEDSLAAAKFIMDCLPSCTIAAERQAK